VIDALGFAAALGSAFEEDVFTASAEDPATVANLVSIHGAVASAAARSSSAYLLFGSWLVFAGGSTEPLTEQDVPDAGSPLGRAWRAVESAVGSAHPDAAIVRAGPLLGSPGARLTDEQDLQPPPNGGAALVSPTFAPDLMGSAIDLLIDGVSGIWHLSNVGVARVEAIPGAPVCAPLGTVRGALLPRLEDALRRSGAVEAAAPIDGRDAPMVMT
jgi:dTDP-4-dehydrorhamnose reductase